MLEAGYAKIQAQQKKGYKVYKAFIRFIVAWKGENDNQEYAVILPDILLNK